MSFKKLAAKVTKMGGMKGIMPAKQSFYFIKSEGEDQLSSLIKISFRLFVQGAVILRTFLFWLYELNHVVPPFQDR